MPNTGDGGRGPARQLWKARSKNGDGLDLLHGHQPLRYRNLFDLRDDGFDLLFVVYRHDHHREVQGEELDLSRMYLLSGAVSLYATQDRHTGDSLFVQQLYYGLIHRLAPVAGCIAHVDT